jgi:uncharacterized membrane protein
MFSIPPLPPWSALHPLVVHFPIVLLLIAPFFLALALFLPRVKAKHAVFTGFALVVIGTGFLFLTVETGDAAAEAVAKTPEIKSVLHDHEELAETTQVVFGTLTFLLAALLFGPRLFKREIKIRSFRTVLSIFLLAYVGGALVLANTAHAGGRLVPELGVTAKITSASGSSIK